MRLPYLITGSQAFLTRGRAALVALAPSMLYTLVLLDLLRTLPSDFFLTVFVVLVLNVAGSAGDVQQAHAFLKLPRAARIRDDGKVTSPRGPATRDHLTARDLVSHRRDRIRLLLTDARRPPALAKKTPSVCASRPAPRSLRRRPQVRAAGRLRDRSVRWRR